MENNLFNEEALGEDISVGNDAKAAKVAAHSEYLKTINAAFAQEVSEKPDLVDVIGSAVNSLTVVKILSSRKVKGSLKVDEALKAATGERKLVPIPGICGYRVQVTGDQPVEVSRTLYHENEAGTYEGEAVSQTFGPGDTFVISRIDLVKLAARPEFSFRLANGTIVGTPKKGDTLDEQLASMSFRYSKVEGAETPSIHDDANKEIIDEEVGDTTVVKPEFVEVFGVLDNPEPVKEKAVRTRGKKVDTQAKSASYVRSLINA